MRKKFLVFSLLTIIIAACGLYIFLQTDACRDYVKSSIEKAVSYTPNFKLTIGELRGSLISNLEAENLLITIGGETFVKADKVSTSYSIPLILSVISRGDIPLYNTVAEGVEVNIIKHDDERWNYQKIGDHKKEENFKKEFEEKKKKKGSKFSLFLRNNTIKSGSVKIINEVKDDLLEFKITDDSLFSVNLIGLNKKFEIEAYDLNVDWLPAGIHFKDFETDAQLAGQNIVFKNTKGNVQGIDVAGQGIVNNFKRPEFNFSAYFNNLDFENIGQFNIYTKSEGRLVSKDNLDANVELSIINSNIRGKRIWTSLEPVQIKGTTADIKGNINTEFGRSYVDGEYNFFRLLTKRGKNAFSFKADLNEVDTTEMFEILDIDPKKFEIGKDSKLNSNLDLNGYWIDKSDYDFKFTYQSLDIRDKQLGNLNAEGTTELFPGRVDLDIKSELRNLNVKSALKTYDFNNTINGNINLKGNIPLGSNIIEKSDLKIESNLTTSFAYGLNNILSIYSGGIKDGKLSINNLKITSDELFFQAKSNQANSALNFNLESSDISFLKSVNESLDFRGEMISNGAIRGNLLNPDLEINAILNDFYFGNDYHAKVIDLDLKSNTDLENFKFDLDSALSDIEVFGKYFNSGKVTLQNKGKQIHANLNLLKDQNQYLNTNLILDDISKTEKTVTLKNIELTVNQNVLGNRDDIVFIFSPSGKVLKNLNLTYKDGILESEGEIRSNGKLDFGAYFTNFDQSIIAAFFNLSDMSGKLSGDIKLTGTVSNPYINTNLVSKDMSFGDFKSRGFNININGRNNRIDLDVKSINREFDELTLAGNIKTDLDLDRISENFKNADLDLQLNTNNFDIGLLKPFLNSVKKLDGTFSSNMKIEGKFSDPVVKGNLDISKTRLRVSQILNELVIEKANLEFENSLIRMQDAKVTSLNGSADISGTFNLNDSTYNGTASLNELYIKLPFLRADMSGDLQLEGADEKVEIKSRLKVANKKIYFQQDETKNVKDIRFIDEDNQDDLIIVTERGPDFFTKNFKIDMLIDIPRGTEIISKGIDVEVVGQMVILKEYNEKNIFRGNIDILKGHYIVLGKLFNIDDGSLNFPSSTNPNPQLEINASYDISDIKVFINITGTAKDPVVSFSSNPPLDRDDIISYLVYGASQENRGDQEQAAIGGGLAANVAAGEISKIIGSNLGLDVLNFQGGESGGLSNPQIQVGSFITDDIFISYERTSDENLTEPRAIDADNRVKLRWKINDKFSVESEIGDQNSGADIIYNFDF